MNDQRPAPPPSAPACAMALALLYFAGPIIIATELLRPIFWVPLALLALPWVATLDAFFFPGRPAIARDVRSKRWPTPKILVVELGAFVLGTAWILYSGIGSFAVCRWDYIKHNVMFSGLLASHLPIFVDGGAAGRLPLNYYFAYYIIPVRIFDALRLVLPSVTLDQVLVALYAVALFLALRALAAGFRVQTATLLLLFILTGGGLDLIGLALFGGQATVAGHVPIIGIPYYLGIEWWGDPKAPQSLTMHLFWAPQHFFGAMIGVALLVTILRLERPGGAKLLHAIGVIAAGAFWSPYAAVGLVLVAAGELLRPGRGSVFSALTGGGPRMATARLVPAAAFYLLLCGFTMLYFTAARASSPPGSIFATVSVGAWLATFLINHAPWIVALAVLLGWRARTAAAEAVGEPGTSRGDLAWTLAFGLAASALLLCIRHGAFNDWALRTTLPVAMVLTAATGRLLTERLPALGRLALLAVLALSSVSSLMEIAFSVFTPPQCAAYGAYGAKDLGELLPQYEGDPTALLYRHFSRQH